MDDRRLRNVSLCLSLVGLFLLAVGVSLKEPRHTDVGSITSEMVGTHVSVTGTATSVTPIEGHIFFKVVDETGTVKAVLFQNDLVRQDFDSAILYDGTKITIEGTVQLYKGSLEIIAHRVTVV